MRRRNLGTSLRCRPSADPMRAFDALSSPLRRWLAGACLPWSPRSVRKVWASALARHGGDVSAALANLERAERKTLARDIPRIWGRGYPGLALAENDCTRARSGAASGVAPARWEPAEAPHR